MDRISSGLGARAAELSVTDSSAPRAGHHPYKPVGQMTSTRIFGSSGGGPSYVPLRVAWRGVRTRCPTTFDRLGLRYRPQGGIRQDEALQQAGVPAGHVRVVP